MFGDNLKKLRKYKDLSMDDLANQYNKKYNGKLNKSTISRYENNLQEPMINVAKNLADFFCVPVGNLTGETQNTFDIFSIPGITPIEKKRFPLLGSTGVSCGEPIFADNHFEGYVEAGTDIRADFCLRANGDSMINARIFDGDIVFIRSQPDVEDGEIAVVLIDDEATLKRVYKYPNRIELRPENPTCRVQNYEGSALENIKILGKAVAFQSDIK